MDGSYNEKMNKFTDAAIFNKPFDIKSKGKPSSGGDSVTLVSNPNSCLASECAHPVSIMKKMPNIASRSTLPQNKYPAVASRESRYKSVFKKLVLPAKEHATVGQGKIQPSVRSASHMIAPQINFNKKEADKVETEVATAAPGKYKPVKR